MVTAKSINVPYAWDLEDNEVATDVIQQVEGMDPGDEVQIGADAFAVSTLLEHMRNTSDPQRTRIIDVLKTPA